MDLLYSDVPAVDGGETRAWLITGTTSKHTSAYKSKGESADHALAAFQDRVREHGRPRRLLTDNASTFRAGRFITYLRDLWIALWQSESYKQNQNPVERRWNLIKRLVNRLLASTGAQPMFWFCALLYVIYCLNACIDTTLPGHAPRSPNMMAKGQFDDISPMLAFKFNEPVYFTTNTEDSFPSESKEERGHFMGIAENVGHKMTWLIYCDATNKLIERSEVRSALTSNL